MQLGATFLVKTKVCAPGLLSVCAPPAQAGTIADAFELFIKQPGQIKKLFGREVAHGDCGPAGDEASVHYKIYEVTNPTVVQDNPFLQQIWQIHDYREDAQYYGVYIFGDGKMADYAATGQKAPWMGNVEVTEYNDKGQVLGTTVVENLGEEYLALAYIADGTDEEWNGRTERYSGVTNVGAYAFKDCRYLTCMFLNDDITTISDHAFYKGEYLSAINMPRKLELIDKYAFYGCDTLTFVRARNCSRLRRIEDHAFYSCTMLAELRLPEGLTYIGPWAFAWDRILGQEDTTLGLPSSLQTISTGAFAFVNHHKNLNIPANVTSIGDYAFMCDYYMNNLTFSPGDKKLTIGKAAFFGDNHMKSVDLSNRVAQIDRCAFAGCGYREGEDIPKLHTHTWDAGVVTQKPTVAEPGVRTYTCTVCGQTKTEAIPATGVPETCNGGPACPGYAFRDMPAPSIWSHAGLDYCIYHGYIAGTSATTVTPDGECTRAMIVSILYRVQGEPAKVNGYELKKLAAPFDDVERGRWYTDAIWWAKLTGVVSGMSPSTFAPDDPITRAQLAVILYNYTKQFAPESLTETGSLTGFPDAGSVPSWARTAMAWAVGNGLISGVGENGVSYLRPEGCATRAQVATILMNYDKALG